MTAAALTELTGPLLREVSRSFYLTLRVLPGEVRPQISLAYLLARASDTIADTKAVPRAKRIVILQQLQMLSRMPELGAIAENQTSAGERRLLERLEDCLLALDAFEEPDCRRIQELLKTIIDGQIFDLQRFPGETAEQLTALRSGEELDRYTYLVAGCVGEFWTKMCMAHFAALRDWDAQRMQALGVRFGKGLQLVNVLRDLPRDFRIGRCYLPVKDPKRLLDPTGYGEIHKLYGQWLDTAVEHLRAASQYTLEIPASETRLRLACIWPIWIGLETIALLRKHNPLNLEQRVKISRARVYRLMLKSLVLVKSDASLTRRTEQLLCKAS